MAGGGLAELDRFAQALSEAQQQLLDVMIERRAALIAADLQALQQLESAEADAARKVQSLVGWRQQMLEAARRAGLRATTLTEIAETIGGPAAQPVRAKLQALQRLTIALQHESWVQWVITNRCCRFYDEVLELISQGGRKSPTYQSSDWVQRGGAVLNASA